MTPERENEAAFVRNLPDEGVVHVDETLPPIICDSDSDADHVDIIKDMRAMGYFDDYFMYDRGRY